MTEALIVRTFPGKKIRGFCTVVGVLATLAMFWNLGEYADYHGAEPVAVRTAESPVDAALSGRVVAITGIVQKRWGDLPPSNFISLDGDSTTAFLAERCRSSGKNRNCSFWSAADIAIGNFAVEPTSRRLHLDATPVASRKDNMDLRYWPIGKHYTVFGRLDADGRTLRPVRFPGPWPRTVMIVANEQSNPRRYIVDQAASFRGWAWTTWFVSALGFWVAGHFRSSIESEKRPALKRAVLWALLILGPTISAMALSYSPWFFHVDLLLPVAIAGFVLWCIRQMMRYFEAGLLS